MVASQLTLDDISAEMEELESPTERLSYLVELGQTLPPFPDDQRIEANRVLGCQSMVWLIARRRPGPELRLDLTADSDAPMVRGLIAILLAAYSGQRPAEIAALPIERTFEQLKLSSFLTPLRSNGLHSMVRRIRQLAADNLPAAAASPDKITPVFGTSGVAASVGQSASSPTVAAPEQPRQPSSPPRGIASGGSKGSASVTRPSATLDVDQIRADFPILKRRLPDDRPLVYLDSAASSQRPRQVLDAMDQAYVSYYANVHRGAHTLAGETTEHYEQARLLVQHLLGARRPHEVIFTSGTTAAINLVARSWGDACCRPDDEIVLTEMEHHSNIVPWQQLAQRTGCSIRWIPLCDDYQLDLEAAQRLFTPRVKLLSMTAVSNVLGTINPVRQLVEMARSVGALVLVDAAQAVPHEAIDVVQWDCDFLVFSGHKMLGPSGIGALYGREELLDRMPPFLGGGSMIHQVTQDGFTPAELPYKFEAGTPAIVPAIGLGAAIGYLEQVGLPAIARHERQLVHRARQLLGEIPGLRLLAPPEAHQSGIATFVVDGVQPAEMAQALDLEGVAIRAGHHCAMPLHARLGLSASSRASFYLYNTLAEVDQLAEGIQRAIRLFRR